MNCNHRCRCGNSICRWAIYSQSVTIATINGVDTLLIDIPAGNYPDGYRYCLFVLQTIPAAATRYMPVAITIGGNQTMVYPLVNCRCNRVTQCAIRNRHWYRVMVSTDGNTGVFKVMRGLACSPDNSAASLPIVTATAATPAAQAAVNAAAAASVKKEANQ